MWTLQNQGKFQSLPCYIEISKFMFKFKTKFMKKCQKSLNNKYLIRSDNGVHSNFPN